MPKIEITSKEDTTQKKEATCKKLLHNHVVDITSLVYSK